MGVDLSSSVVIEDGMRGFAEGYSSRPVYFYCSRSTVEPDRSNTREILGCIARQLSSQSPEHPLSTTTTEHYERRALEGSSRRSKPSMEECRQLIVKLTEQYPLTTIVVDALDECDVETRGDLVEALETILADSASLVKVFVTSREEGDLRFLLQTHPRIQVTPNENGPDIQTFVNFETDRLVAKNQLLATIKIKPTKDELKTLIKADVIAKAGSM